MSEAGCVGGRAPALLPIPQVLRAKLISRGYATYDDLCAVTTAQLARDCGMTLAEAQRVVEESAASIARDSLAHARTALDLFHEERTAPRIITFCKELDELLGGGIDVGRLTEVCGTPGAGKTQLSMQLSLNVQIPEALGGVGGEAVYIDTEGSLSVVRRFPLLPARRPPGRRPVAVGDGSPSPRLLPSRIDWSRWRALSCSTWAGWLPEAPATRLSKPQSQ